MLLHSSEQNDGQFEFDYVTSDTGYIVGRSRSNFTLLEKKGITAMPSTTNFIIFPIDMEGDDFLEKIYARKVVVRAFKFWDQNWCRVSLGTMDEMKHFTAAIDEILV